MLGSRAIWHDGWKAVSTHPTISGWSHFNDDTWELYHVDDDRAELHDLAAEHPDKVRELVNLWFAEAGANGAFPLDDRSAVEILNTPRPQLTSPRDRYLYYPDVAGVPEAQSVNIRNRNYIIGARGRRPRPWRERRAVRPGLALRRARPLRQGQPAALRLQLRRHARAEGCRHRGDVPTGEDLILSASFVKDGEDPPGVSTGILSLFHGEDKVGEGRIKTQPSAFGLSGTDLTVGRAHQQHHRRLSRGNGRGRSPAARSRCVAVDVSGEPYVDLERAAAAMIARE